MHIKMLQEVENIIYFLSNSYSTLLSAKSFVLDGSYLVNECRGYYPLPFLVSNAGRSYYGGYIYHKPSTHH
jgi:hypothetical protein